MTRAVIVQRQAVNDLVRITRRITKTVSRSSAVRWRDGVDAVIRELASTADQWPEAEEAADLDLPLRFQTYGQHRQVYRILYYIDDDSVQVVQIRHAAQDRLTHDDF